MDTFFPAAPFSGDQYTPRQWKVGTASGLALEVVVGTDSARQTAQSAAIPTAMK